MALEWTHGTAEIGAGGIEIEREATSTECKDVADALGILGCKSIRVSYSVAPSGRLRYRVKGAINAHLVQTCVVSLDPVDELLSTEFDLEFRPPDQFDDQVEVEVDGSHGDDPEPIADGQLEVGRVIFELISEHASDYPRKPGEELERTQSDGSGALGSTGPFAKLADLKIDD